MRTLLLWLATLAFAVGPLTAAESRTLPYRFLLVVGDEWKDETSTLGDTVETALIAELAGVVHISDDKLPDGLAFTREHFITRGLVGREHRTNTP